MLTTPPLNTMRIIWTPDEAAGCIDPAKRLEITKEVNDYLMNTATYLPLLHKAVAFVWNKDLNVVNRPVNPIIYDWSWN